MFRTTIEFPSETDELWCESFYCYICGELLTRQIVYCEHGHLVCGKCSIATRCSCSKRLTKVRVTYLENIIRASKFICQYGCGVNLTNEEYSCHVEETCRFRPINCWLCPQYTNLVKYRNYIQHLKKIHNIETFGLDDNGEGEMLISNIFPAMHLVIYQDKTFFLCWAKESQKVWVQSYENPMGISVQIETPTFRCDLRISKPHSTLNSADIDVLRLVMNEKVRIKFSGVPTNPSTPSSSVCSSNRTSGIPTEDELMSNRISAMSISSNGSSGEGQSGSSLSPTNEEVGLPLPIPITSNNNARKNKKPALTPSFKKKDPFLGFTF